MYESFFGLKGQPFKLSPDPGFFYASSTHAKGLAYLHYGLQQGEGFVVVTGVPGTGKTTLLNILMQDPSLKQFVVVKLSNTLLNVDDLFRTIAHFLHLKSDGCDRVDLLEELELYLQRLAQAGKRVLLLIDEAHNLSPRILEELRLLSNLQYRDQYTLQIFLLGQFQLEETLNLTDMLQLRQRVLVSHRLMPISFQEIDKYIKHRLTTAGWQSTPAFSSEAFQLIYRYTEGIPRQINTLCDRILLYAYLDEKKYIDTVVVEGVIEELRHEPASYAHRREFADADVNGVANVTRAISHAIGEGNVVVWPSRSLDFHKIETRFPVDRACPNALEIPVDDSCHDKVPVMKVPVMKVPVTNANSGLVKRSIENSAVEIHERAHADTAERIDADAVGAPRSDKRIADPSNLEKTVAVKAQFVPELDADHEQKVDNEQGNEKRHITAYKAKWVAAVSGISVSLFLVASIIDDSPSMIENSDKILEASSVEFFPLSIEPERSNILSIEVLGENQKNKIGDIDLIEAPASVVLITDVNVVDEATVERRDNRAQLDAKKNVSLEKSPEIHKLLEKKTLLADPVGKPRVEENIISAKADINSENEKISVLANTLSVEVEENKKPEPPELLVQATEVAPPVIADNVNKKSTGEDKHALLGNLIQKFTIAYRDGDISQFVSLFSPDVESNDSSGVDALKNEYQKLFNVTDVRKIEIDDFSWQMTRNALNNISGEGDFQLMIVEKGGSKPVSYIGGISLEVDMNQSEPVITQIRYSYNE